MIDTIQQSLYEEIGYIVANIKFRNLYVRSVALWLPATNGFFSSHLSPYAETLLFVARSNRALVKRANHLVEDRAERLRLHPALPRPICLSVKPDQNFKVQFNDSNWCTAN
jgi:hypothetical protein